MLNMALKGVQKGFKLNKMPNWHLHCIHCIFCKICEGIIHITPVLRSLKQEDFEFKSQPKLYVKTLSHQTKFIIQY